MAKTEFTIEDGLREQAQTAGRSLEHWIRRAQRAGTDQLDTEY